MSPERERTNLFIIAGAGSPSTTVNLFPAIEQHVDFIADLIEHMRVHDLPTAGAHF